MSSDDISKMNMYEKLDEIQTKLLKEQFDKKSGYRSKYIPLEELIMKIKPVCREYGVTFYFTAIEDFLVLKVFDKKTEKHLSPSPQVRLPALKDRETEGGNYTYLKRYLLMDTFLIIAESSDPDDMPTSSSAEKQKPQNHQSNESKKDEVADLPMGELVLEARDKLVKKGVAEKDITSKALKQTVLHLRKWTVSERRCILNYFKEDKEASK